MLGPQLELIFTKCLQKEKNITFFFLRIRHLILPQKLLKTKFVKLGPLVGKVRWNHEEDLVCATFHGPGVVWGLCKAGNVLNPYLQVKLTWFCM